MSVGSGLCIHRRRSTGLINKVDNRARVRHYPVEAIAPGYTTGKQASGDSPLFYREKTWLLYICALICHVIPVLISLKKIHN